jgi:hypothetical protein
MSNEKEATPEVPTLTSEDLLVDALGRIQNALHLMQSNDFASAHRLLNESSSLVSILAARKFTRAADVMEVKSESCT